MKQTLSVLVLSMFISLTTLAQSQSKYPSSNNSAVGWSSLTNAYTEDEVYAQGPSLSNGTSSRAILQGFNFTVPSGATITGFEVTVDAKAYRTSGYEGTGAITVKDFELMLVKNGVVQSGGNRASGTFYSTADSIRTYGSSIDSWNNVWTPTDINSGGFGVAYSYQGNNSSRLKLDFISIKVFYSYISLPIKLINFDAIRTNSSDVQVRWTTAEESNISHFEVQKSSDGISFNAVEIVIANNFPSSYKFKIATSDHKPYFRLKTVDQDGKFSYSNVVFVHDYSSYQHKIYVTGRKIVLERSQKLSNSEDFYIFDTNGRMVASFKKLKSQSRMLFDANLVPGRIYFLHSSDGETFNFLY